MQYRLNSTYSAPELKNKLLTNFKGVDYTKAELDVADFRASDMQNFIFKDGINQKRNGFEQQIKIPKETGNESTKVNGYWEFKDSEGTIHRIAHIGNYIYNVNLDGDLFERTYTRLIPNEFYKKNLYTDKSLKDQRSFGIVRGDRLYIFAGKMLVYGKFNNENDNRSWQLRFVRDNEDTYIPTTTTNITPIGYEGDSTRASLEEVNMMSTLRTNKLFGSNLSLFNIDFKSYSPSHPGAAFANTFNVGYRFNGLLKNTISSIIFSAFGESVAGPDTYTSLEMPIELDGQTHSGSYDEATVSVEFNVPLGFKDMIPSFSYRYKYNVNSRLLDFYAYLGAKNQETVISLLKQNFKLSYQLDAKNIAKTPKPVVKYNNESYIFETDGTCKKESNNEVSNDFFLNYEEGILDVFIDCESQDSLPNIDVYFTTDKYLEDKPYENIDNCTIGQVFGYNGIENLFVSGNPLRPNYDWHTSMCMLPNEKSEISNYQNLTYFGELSYAILGNAQTKIKSYLLLNDNTLGILKEHSNNEASLFVREPYFTDALDPSGRVVLDFNNKTYQKLYYKQFMAAIGQGCISSYASANLAGDKIFLSENGVFGIELDYNNINTHQRYAKEKSRLINRKLEEFGAKTLENGSAIVFNNRYYLSINDKEGTVYVADARFRNSAASEMNDTMGYEWWVWKGVNAYIWYKDINGNLGFGTKDGRIYLFNNSELFSDRSHERINGLNYNSATDIFTIDPNYIINKNTKIRFDTTIKESIFKSGDLIYNKEKDLIIPMDIDKFYNYARYVEENIDNINKNNVLLARKDGSKEYTMCILVNVDYNNKGFKLRKVVLLNGKYNALNEYINAGQEWNVNKPIYEELPIDYNVTNHTFKLLAVNGLDHMDIFDEAHDTNLQAFLIYNRPVKSVWFTPYMNMDTNDYAKTLRYITIVPEHILHGSANIYFLTNGNEKYYTNENKIEVDPTVEEIQNETPVNFFAEGVDYLSYLHDLDLNYFSLEMKDFAKSFSKKIKIRNFNFLMLCLISDNDKNFAVENINLSYVISKRNRGVR